jgi:TrfA protein
MIFKVLKPSLELEAQHLSREGRHMSKQQLKPSKRVQGIQERCLELAEVTRQRESAQVIQLPLWPEGKRGTPNSFLRSALFAAIQSKDRIYLEEVILASQQGITVKFTGKQLNQEDMTVWMALVDLSRQHPLGTEYSFTAYGILRHMGFDDGGDQRERFHTSIKRLTDCTVRIETSQIEYGGHLIEEYKVDKDTKHYKIILNKKLIRLFDKNDWTAINWEQRKQLRRKPLASKLHEYYSSHEFPKAISFEFLYRITGSQNRQLADFKRKVKAALDELIKISFLESYKIEGNLVTVKRGYEATAKQK